MTQVRGDGTGSQRLLKIREKCPTEEAHNFSPTDTHPTPAFLKSPTILNVPIVLGSRSVITITNSQRNNMALFLFWVFSVCHVCCVVGNAMTKRDAAGEFGRGNCQVEGGNRGL
jgi:hypothetical protein